MIPPRSRRGALQRAGCVVALGLACAAAVAMPQRASAASPKRRALAVTLTKASVRTNGSGFPSRVGRSVGSPTDGHLVGGVHLDESPWVRVVPVYAGAQWGLDALVSMLDRAGRSVRKQYGDSVLSIGHLSRPGGGEIDRHASHESGRDADVGFYIVNERSKPIYADHFVAFKGDGTAPTWPGARFDDARNWALIAAIAGDGRTRVSHIFVAIPMRARLLAYAAKIGSPPYLRDRAALLMMQPRGGLPHDDHFHVRISCPSGMEGCVELATRNLVRAGRSRSHILGTRVHPHTPPTPTPASQPPSAPSPIAPPNHGAMPAPGADPIVPSPLPGPAHADPPPLPAFEPPAVLETPTDPIDDVDGLDDE